jgi:hypothetical protein
MSNIAGPDPAVMEAIERGNQVVFLDVTMGEADDKESSVNLGRIKIELFVKDVSIFDSNNCIPNNDTFLYKTKKCMYCID